MVDRIKTDFQERRARVLKKHAARDPEWRQYRRERRANVFSVVGSVLLALGLIAIGWKGLTIAQLGADGFRQTVAALSDSAAGQTLPAWVLGTDPLSDAVADFLNARNPANTSETVAALDD